MSIKLRHQLKGMRVFYDARKYREINMFVSKFYLFAFRFFFCSSFLHLHSFKFIKNIIPTSCVVDVGKHWYGELCSTHDVIHWTFDLVIASLIYQQTSTHYFSDCFSCHEVSSPTIALLKRLSTKQKKLCHEWIFFSDERYKLCGRNQRKSKGNPNCCQTFAFFLLLAAC